MMEYNPAINSYAQAWPSSGTKKLTDLNFPPNALPFDSGEIVPGAHAVVFYNNEWVSGLNFKNIYYILFREGQPPIAKAMENNAAGAFDTNLANDYALGYFVVPASDPRGETRTPRSHFPGFLHQAGPAGPAIGTPTASVPATVTSDPRYTHAP